MIGRDRSPPCCNTVSTHHDRICTVGCLVLVFRVTNARRLLQVVAALNVGWMNAAVSTLGYTAFARTDRPLIQLIVSCWHLQLYTHPELLGPNDQKPMHPVPWNFLFKRVFHHRLRHGDFTHARVFHFLPSAIPVTKSFHK